MLNSVVFLNDNWQEFRNLEHWKIINLNKGKSLIFGIWNTILQISVLPLTSVWLWPSDFNFLYEEGKHDINMTFQRRNKRFKEVNWLAKSSSNWVAEAKVSLTLLIIFPLFNTILLLNFSHYKLKFQRIIKLYNY